MPAADPRAYHAKWREKNREKLSAKSLDYYYRNRREILQRVAEAKKRERLAEIEWMNKK